MSEAELQALERGVRTQAKELCNAWFIWMQALKRAGKELDKANPYTSLLKVVLDTSVEIPIEELEA